MSDFLKRVPITCECGDHAFVALTRGYVTLVSPVDAPLLRNKWRAKSRENGTVSACRDVWKGPHQHLHVMILQTDAAGLIADHINCNPLDNRRPNLRPATPAENSRNRSALKRELPKGVWRRSGRFAACIHINYRTIHLGYFDTAEDAHAAYVEAAAKLFGDFARAA